MEAIKGNDITQDDYTKALMEITNLEMQEDAFGEDHSKEIKELKKKIEWVEEAE